MFKIFIRTRHIYTILFRNLHCTKQASEEMGNTASSIEQLVMYGDVLELKQQVEKMNNQEQDECSEQVNHGLRIAAGVRDRKIQQMQCMMELLLLQAGADVNSVDEHGWSCLHHACAVGNVDLVPFLIKCKAVVKRDQYGLLPQDLLPFEQAEPSTQTYDVIRAQLNDLLQPPSEYCLAFGNNKKHSDELNQVVCLQHEYGTPAVLKYSSPEGSTEKGYIQLLFRPAGLAVEQQPVYGGHLPIVKGSHRGVVQFDTSQVPENAVCHFVYVACDPSMMSRKVVASTNALWLRSGVSQYTLKVAGELFHHSSKELDGQEFCSTEALSSFIQNRSGACHEQASAVATCKNVSHNNEAETDCGHRPELPI